MNTRSSLLGLLLACALLLSGCSVTRAYDAALVLADTVAGKAPSRLKSVTPAPQRSAITFQIGGRERAADLYRPGVGQPRAAVVLVPGAVQHGRNEAAIVAFANTLTRAGFAVVVPAMAGFADLGLYAGDVQEVADAFTWLASQTELSAGGRVGLVGISYSVGPVVLAALRADLREQVRFIFGVGGYHDLRRTLLFITTGWFEHDGRWQALEPNAYGQLVLALSARRHLASAHDRALLQTMVERRLADRQAGLDDLAAQLSAEGRRVFDLISNRDRQRFAALFDALPASMRRELEALDLAHQELQQLQARLILVHGKNDTLFPFTESLALAQAVGGARTQLFLIHHVLGHVDPNVSALLTWRFWRHELPDVWRMARATYLLLAERADV
ncbi:CocE/NonD family hydrolase [Hydrogenophaga sp.]|uniref:alpha/beta hydrolase family protein n=1 Tax=Hydrogenophaga sp. TaxID=1904254 RepID=UPI0019B463DF|nr:CocE/NonD family hydrolase [Hydrogenophaga sp.]MBD3894231.1 alpha/beta hydrolase [Hydrogenophaga sp.]